jgi:hypothetical protein
MNTPQLADGVSRKNIHLRSLKLRGIAISVCKLQFLENVTAVWLYKQEQEEPSGSPFAWTIRAALGEVDKYII